MYKLCFYVPIEQAEAVKTAVFATGAGRIGNYDSCCWQVAGQGQFRPLPGSDPFVGKAGAVHVEPELKIELVCAEQHIQAAVAALKASHPYEEPAYQVWRLAEI